MRLIMLMLSASLFLLNSLGCQPQTSDVEGTKPGPNSSTNFNLVAESLKKPQSHDEGKRRGNANAEKEPQKKTSKTLRSFPFKEPLNLLSAEEVQAGWISLFDGQTFFGWRANNEVNWTIQEGVITADTGKPGLLLTSVPFSNFQLRCEFRLEQEGNSGIFLRTISKPSNPAEDCYELNICDSHDAFPTGSLVGRAKVPQTPTSDGKWNRFDVRVEGKVIEVKLNGKQILSHKDEGEHFKGSGYIGLQKNSGKIEFKNIALKPLGMQSLFNQKDLSGWQVVADSKSTFEVKDGSIHIENGRGFLESKETFDNFLLQAEVRTNGTALNSGIFFRAKPGTQESPSDGYEFQIQNGIENQDRSQPLDQGTGAIFRRQPARWVNANDKEWFTGTVIAHGRVFATWVNGLQVVTWIDRRAADENPRVGYREKAGHLSLQGHDPTTNLDFRSIRILKYPSK